MQIILLILILFFRNGGSRNNPPGYHRRNRSSPFKRYQTQLVPGSSDPYKYIPLRGTSTPSPRLWWQPLSINIPSSYSNVAIQESAKATTAAPDSESSSSTEARVETTTIETPAGDTDEDLTTLSDDDYFETTTTMMMPMERWALLSSGWVCDRATTYISETMCHMILDYQ